MKLIIIIAYLLVLSICGCAKVEIEEGLVIIQRGELIIHELENYLKEKGVIDEKIQTFLNQLKSNYHELRNYLILLKSKVEDSSLPPEIRNELVSIIIQSIKEFKKD